MSVKNEPSESTWVDPDDAPELTEEWFKSADQYVGKTLVRRGRPPKGDVKESTTIRLDAEVLAHFKATGPGWQTRINDALRRVAGLETR